MVDIEIKVYGGLCHIVCYGAYGGSGMLDALRIVNHLFLTLRGCLVGVFKQQFLVFKHHNTYFHNTF